MFSCLPRAPSLLLCSPEAVSTALGRLPALPDLRVLSSRSQVSPGQPTPEAAGQSCRVWGPPAGSGPRGGRAFPTGREEGCSPLCPAGGGKTTGTFQGRPAGRAGRGTSGADPRPVGVAAGADSPACWWPRGAPRSARGTRCHSPALLPDFRVGLTPPSFPPSLPPRPPPPPPQVPGPRPARWGGASDPRGAGRVSPTQLEAAPSPAEGCYPGSWDRLASLGGVALSTLPVAGGRGHIFPRPPPGHPAGETPKPTVIPLEEKQGLAGVRLGRL